MKELSIIVPIYNVEAYLEECVKSCLHQNIPHSQYEILLVNDGSTDSSPRIAERIQKEYPDVIQLIHQNNKGLSVARNTGLKYAKGKYIWFVDSDDKIKENCLKDVISLIEKEKLDILAVCAAFDRNGILERRFSFNGIACVETGVDKLRKKNIQLCAPFSIYLKSLLDDNKISFMPGVYHEDHEFTPRVYYFAKRIGYINDLLYYVTINPNSITRVIRPKRAFDYIKVAESLDDFSVIHRDASLFFQDEISLIINNAFFIISKSSKEDCVYSKKNFLELLSSKNKLLKNLCKSSMLKYRIEGYLFALFPKQCYNIYRALRILS